MLRRLTLLAAVLAAGAIAAPAAGADDATATATATTTATATPGQVDAAVAYVQEAVAGIESSSGTKAPHAYTVTMAALNYVQANVSSAIYAYRAAHGLSAPTTAEEALAEQAGICGNQVEVFLEVLHRLGQTAIPAQFFFTADGSRQNHVAAEVRWSGAWHFVDVSYGAVFWKRAGHLLSLATLLKDAHPLRWAHRNELDAWTGSALLKGWHPYAYLEGWTRRQVVSQGSGSVTPPAAAAARSSSGVTYDLTLLPDYVGVGLPYAGQQVGVSFALATPAAATRLVLAVRTQGCPGGGTVHAGTTSVDLAAVPWSGAFAIAIPRAQRGGTVTLSVTPKVAGTPCEIVVDGLSAS
jgi:hypothetical protein